MSTLFERQAAVRRAMKRQTLLRAQGLCLTCGRQPAAPSRLRPGQLATRCAFCIDRRRAVRRGEAEPLKTRHAKAVLQIASAYVPSQLAPLKPHRSETIIAKRPMKPPSDSWWVGHTTRESFNARWAEEMKRMPMSGGVADLDRVSYAPSMNDGRRWSKKAHALPLPPAAIDALIEAMQ